MRTIGKLNTESEASAFGDYLYSKSIEHQIEADDEGGYSIWVVNDEQLTEARELFEKYIVNPAAIDIKQISRIAEKKRTEEEKAEARRRSVVASEERVIYERSRGRQIFPVTVALIALSVVVSFFTDFGNHPTTYYLYFVPDLIFSGQIWRAVSPIFLHLSKLHLLFNMFWLFDLGGMIERRFGKLYMGLFVAGVAIVSCFVQYCWDGPRFGGMSGVVYGLFGFIWIRSKFDSRHDFALNQNSIIMMIGWLFLCMSGLVGPVANAAHVAGLLAGMAWAFATRLSFRN